MEHGKGLETKFQPFLEDDPELWAVTESWFEELPSSGTPVFDRVEDPLLA